MDPISSLKRESSVMVDYTACIICQEKRKDELRTPSERGVDTTKKCTNERKKLHDTKYRAVIDRLDEVFQSATPISLLWHRLCYAAYTDNGKISKLRSHVTEQPKPSCSSLIIRPRQSSVEQVDWQQCIFCQRPRSRSVRLISVK